jgi:hypothetical protein
MNRVLKPRYAGFWLLAASISACAVAGPTGARGDQLPTPTRGYATLQAGSPAPELQGVASVFPFLGAVTLTAAQTSRIEAILTRQSAAATVPRPPANAQAILTAPTLNTAALRTLLTTAETQQRASVVRGVATMAAVRAELTASQRQTASEAVLQVRTNTAQSTQPQPEPSSDLTAAQIALFRAAEPPARPPAAVAKALSTFLKTGDTAAYLAATGPTRSVSAQVDAVVAALSSLTPAQRRAMFTAPTANEQMSTEPN